MRAYERRGALRGALDLPTNGKLQIGWIEVMNKRKEEEEQVWWVWLLLKWILNAFFPNRAAQNDRDFLEMHVPVDNIPQEEERPGTPDDAVLVGCTINLAKRIRKSIKRAFKHLLR